MRVRGRQINLRSSYTLADVCGTIFIGTCAPQAASRPIVDCLTWCSAGVCVCMAEVKIERVVCCAAKVRAY